MTPPPASAWEPTAEDIAFYDVYGAWDPLTPAELARLMDGFPRPWWIVGGYAIEAFTGVPRFHEDIDLVIFTSDFPHLRAQLGDVRVVTLGLPTAVDLGVERAVDPPG